VQDKNLNRSANFLVVIVDERKREPKSPTEVKQARHRIINQLSWCRNEKALGGWYRGGKYHYGTKVSPLSDTGR